MQFDLMTILGLLAGIGLIIYFAKIYNGLVELSNNVRKAWSDIDVLCKQRHDEIPKLVTACQEYMGYEQETLKQVMDARGSVLSALGNGNAGQLGQAESSLRKGLGGLFALAENYPDLKATNSFQQLQVRVSSLETAISGRRERYNESANLKNIRIQQFPDMFMARTLRFKHADLLEFDDSETEDVDLKSLFKK